MGFYHNGSLSSQEFLQNTGGPLKDLNGVCRRFVDTWLSRQCGLFAPPCERSGAEIARRGMPRGQSS